MNKHGEIKVYHDMHNLIERKAYFMWCNQGKPDGEEEVDFGCGKKKLCEYHWLLASLEAEMESWSAFRKMGPVTTSMGEGYFYCSDLPLTQTPVMLDPETFRSRKGILTRYGRKLLAEKEAKLTPVDEPSCEEVTMEETTIHFSDTDDVTIEPTERYD